MLAFISAFFSWLAGRFRSRAELELEVFALRHQLAILRRQRPGRPRLCSIDRLLWVWLYRALAALSGCHRVGEASHRGPVAPARLSALLALAVSARAQSGRSRHSQADPRDVLCQPALGCAAHTWRVAQARYRDQSGDGCQVHPAPATHAIADLVQLPQQPKHSVSP